MSFRSIECRHWLEWRFREHNWMGKYYTTMYGEALTREECNRNRQGKYWFYWMDFPFWGESSMSCMSEIRQKLTALVLIETNESVSDVLGSEWRRCCIIWLLVSWCRLTEDTVTLSLDGLMSSLLKRGQLSSPHQSDWIVHYNPGVFGDKWQSKDENWDL